MRIPNILFSISLIVLSLYIFSYSQNLGSEASKFPIIISIPLFICALLMLILILTNKYKNIGKLNFDYTKLRKFLQIIIVMVIYSFIINYVGYLISTLLLFMLITVILSESRRQQRNNLLKFITISTLTVGFIFFVFKIVLNVPLPEFY